MRETERIEATLLVVDDTESNIDVVLRILDGYDLIPATSGADALALLKSEQVDLILLDIMMPGMDGFEVCTRVKADPATRDIPIIFITAKDDEESIEKAYEIGGYDYVTKPFKPCELQARVHTQLTLYRQYRRLSQQNLELTRAEQALCDSEERYRLAMEAAREGLWDWDVRTGAVYYSPAWCRILGQQAVRNDYSTWEERIHPDDKERILSSLRAHLAGKSGDWAEEHRLRNADGAWTWVMGRGRVAQRDGEGRPLRMVGTMSDIHVRKQTEKLNQLRQQLAELVYSADLEQLMRTALDCAEQMTDSGIGFYHFVDLNQRNVSLQVWSTQTGEVCRAEEGHGLHYPVSQAGVWVDCVRQRRPVVHNDYASLAHRKGLPEGHPALVRELTVPVMREGRVVAVMGVGNKPRDYDGEDREIVGHLADIAHDFVERKKIEQRIEYMAFHDVLTGLPNRELLMDRLQQAISMTRRSNRLLAVCYLDLDGFKPVNDRFGHQVGDLLLIDLARRLSGELRRGDTLARLGGDEFVILLNGLAGIFDGEGIIDRILEVISRPFEIEGHSIQVSGSIGVTFFPLDDADAHALLRHADQAMYQAKEAGKSIWRLFEQVREQKVRSRRKELQEFEQALENRQLELYYQPRVELSSGRVVGAEALVRWRHPQRGLLLPGSFLPLVDGIPEEFVLGEWVLKSALEQHLAWRTAGLELPVSVNLSTRHLCMQGFAEVLQRLLSDCPEGAVIGLELELPEGVALGDTAEVAEAMQACRELGVTFALDDLGDSYTSLTHLHRLPIDVLKIDRNIVRSILDRERDLDIVEGALRWAYGLKRTVVAGGVESVEIGMMLLQLGCLYAQGYGIAKPMPADQIEGWLVQWSSSNIWHRLQAEATGLPAHYDLNVSIFSHRHWVDTVIRYIETGDPEALPILDGTQCQFERWYRGIGLIRYGNHPSYPSIPPIHSMVHELANTLVTQADAGERARALAGVAELRRVSGEMIEMLGRLG